MRNLSCDCPSVTHGQSYHVRFSPMKHPTAAVPCSTLLSLAVLLSWRYPRPSWHACPSYQPGKHPLTETHPAGMTSRHLGRCLMLCSLLLCSSACCLAAGFRSVSSLGSGTMGNSTDAYCLCYQGEKGGLSLWIVICRVERSLREVICQGQGELVLSDESASLCLGALVSF